MSLKIVSINRGGRATLSDGTIWRIAPDDLKKINWEAGTEVTMSQSPPSSFCEFRVTAVETGVSVGVNRTKKF